MSEVLPLLNTRNKEEPLPDFERVFLKRLGEIKPLEREKSEYWSSFFGFKNFKPIKKEIPALLLYSRNQSDKQSCDLWITDPSEIKLIHHPHAQVTADLAEFLKTDTENLFKKFLTYPISARILQDENNTLYLLVDEGWSDFFTTKISRSLQENSLLDFLDRYKIKKIIGVHSADNLYLSENIAKTIIDEDLIGQRREDLLLYDFAKRYNMTNTQYMRFRVRVKSATNVMTDDRFKEFISIYAEKIAQEVIEDDKK